MGRNKGSIILYIIVGLAVIGLVASLIKNPGGFLMSIFIMIGIAFVIFMVMRAILNRRGGMGTTDEMKKYKKAVKQSKLKYKQEQPVDKRHKSNTPTHAKAKRKRRHGPHLTVIEGKKGSNKDKNDRASN